MSAKLLNALTDDNPDLHKQIGCMTGIFQLFDRHHIFANRRINGHSRKRLPLGPSYFDGERIVVEPNNDKSVYKNVNEKQGVSTESSRASFSSSSCSSSFSSFDCNKIAQPESSSFDRSIFAEALARVQPVNQPNASPRLGRYSLDLRDVVRDSIYREGHGLSVKTTIKQEAVNRVVRHRDSPRPLQLSKSMDGSHRERISGKPVESFRVLSKFQEASRYSNDTRESPRSSYEAKDGSLFLVQKEAPRFSYDERELRRQSFESRETVRSTTKIKELPRLSLDSREGSMRRSNTDSKPASFFRDLHRVSGNSEDRISSLQQELGTQKRPPSSVVAKLMGLEPLPDSILDNEDKMGSTKKCLNDDHGPFARSPKTAEESKQIRTSSSPKNSCKDPVSPRLRNLDIVMKPISSSRFPIEPAPWRQPAGGRVLRKPAFGKWESPAQVPNSSPSVYSEIEKRLKELEFKQSNKDLRALKQILETIQAKAMSNTRKEEDQASNFVFERNNSSPKYTNHNRNPRVANLQNSCNNCLNSGSMKGTSPSRTSESPIVIMKPIKNAIVPASAVIPIDGLSGLHKPRSVDSVNRGKGSVNVRTAKDLSPRNGLRDPVNRALSSTDKKPNEKSSGLRHNARSQQSPRENSISSGRNSGSVSPRLQQKKLELEKRSRPPIPLPDSSKPKSRQPTELGSPGGKLRPKFPNLQQSDDQLSETSTETRYLSLQEDEISLQSDNNLSLASHTDVEVTSADRSAEVNAIQQGNRSPSRKISNSVLKKKKQIQRLSEDGSATELATATSEQPSPVSVLEASLYRDELPSPVKNISNVFKDDETRSSDDNPGEEWNPVDINSTSESSATDFSSAINLKKLEKIERLVQKLRQLNSNHNEASTDYIASLCENTNPDHRYISEILLASGLLLRDLTSGLKTIQLHPSGHPINPDLFYVLEQTKAKTGPLKDEHDRGKIYRPKADKEQLHRKLIFDTVNEILVQKLALAVPSQEPCFRRQKLAVKIPCAMRLLRELCSEIEQLQSSTSGDKMDDKDDGPKIISCEDMMYRLENWTDFGSEVSAVVLDVERLLFKDLIDEIVSGEAARLRARPSRRSRLLFTK